ncbi:hypothetical protein CANCADRAFT_11378, partial [Tortispora caseinolytica NRRL Y-17796]
DRDVVVLRGSPTESAGYHLNGRLRLVTSESCSVRRITLRMYGTVRINWSESLLSAKGIANSKLAKFESVVFEKEWSFLDWANSKNVLHTLSAGSYEYPFDTIIPGSIPESVEGLESAIVIYKMKATIERGRFSNNIVRKKVIHIVRTLAPDSIELLETVSIDNTWPDKIEYSISIPSKAVPIGSAVPININMLPLLKGLKLGSIMITLKEYEHFKCGELCTSNIKTVAHSSNPPPPESELGDDSWSFKLMFQIPTSLAKVVQDCDIKQGLIRIRHKLKFAISLHNPDGHVSELRASLPIALFISPNIPVTVPSTSTVPEHLFSPVNCATGDDIHTSVPPAYAEHIYDRLWEDIPNSHLLETPMASGANTPSLRSRRNSNDAGEHFGSIGSVGSMAREPHSRTSRSTSGATTPRFGYHHGSIVGSLHDDAFFNSVDHSHFSLAHTPCLYTPAMSPSLGSPAADSQDEYDLDALSRVPSYTTAVRSQQPLSDDAFTVPDYD